MATGESRASFGERLRRLRVAAGLSQEALAERAGLSAQAIGALETGKRRRPYPHTIAALAAALGLTEQERAVLAEARSSSTGTSADMTLSARPSLPRRRTPLIGREADIESVLALLKAGEERLVTLTGPGGVGKTSLALAVAEAAAETIGGDVAFVPLATIVDSALVPSEVAAALGLHVSGQQSPHEVVRGSLRGRRTLLVLDNLEHLPDAALWIAGLLADCPGTTVLTTSRAPLRLQDEREVVVEPLALPKGDAVPAQLGDSPSVRLFVQRAPAPAFALTPMNAAAVSEICRRVDGLPLAIELAAARTKVLSPTELLTRLDRMLPLLTGGPHDKAARQRSMGAAIGWSYDLLDPDEQALFRRLAVFSGGFALEAAERVSGDGSRASEALRGDHSSDTRNPSPETLDRVASLVDKSLLRRLDAGEGEPRFGMLATIREFGLERLAAAGEAAATRQAHAAYFLSLAEQTWPAFRQRAGLDRLEAERSNLRAALSWMDQSDDVAALLRLTGAMSWLWYIRGPLDEGRFWLERALAAPGAQAPGMPRARAMIGATLLAHYQGDDERALARAEASLAESEQIDDSWFRGSALVLLGIIAEDQGSYRLAEERFVAALPLFEAIGDRSNIALTLNHLGVAAWGQGDAERAVAQYEASLALQRELDEGWGISVSLGYLGLLAGERGGFADAAALHRESLQLRWDAGAWEDIAASFADLAALAAAIDRPEQAARFFGAATAVREETGRLLEPLFPERGVFEAAEERARSALGPEGYAAALAEGRALPREAAIDEAAAFADEVARRGDE